MDGVAAGADHVVQSVLGPADVGAADGLGVAAQAGVENFRRRQFREGDDGGFAALRLDVSLAGSMAAFASGPIGGFFSGGDAFEVRVFVEIGPDVGVTGAAYLASDESGRLSGQGHSAAEDERY